MVGDGMGNSDATLGALGVAPLGRARRHCRDRCQHAEPDEPARRHPVAPADVEQRGRNPATDRHCDRQRVHGVPDPSPRQRIEPSSTSGNSAGRRVDGVRQPVESLAALQAIEDGLEQRTAPAVAVNGTGARHDGLDTRLVRAPNDDASNEPAGARIGRRACDVARVGIHVRRRTNRSDR